MNLNSLDEDENINSHEL